MRSSPIQEKEPISVHLAAEYTMQFTTHIAAVYHAMYNREASADSTFWILCVCVLCCVFHVTVTCCVACDSHVSVQS